MHKDQKNDVRPGTGIKECKEHTFSMQTSQLGVNSYERCERFNNSKIPRESYSTELTINNSSSSYFKTLKVKMTYTTPEVI